MAGYLVNTASKAVTEELFREFNKALQLFCNEERDRIAIFRTLRYYVNPIACIAEIPTGKRCFDIIFNILFQICIF